MRKLMESIGRSVKERIKNAYLSSLEEDIRKFILQEFASNGKPPSLQEIKEKLNIPSLDSVKQTIEKLEKFDLLEREGEKIVSSYPFSAIETPHKVIFKDGHEVNALCATDALGIHFMLEKDLKIQSICPKCNQDIEIVVKNGNIDSFFPEGLLEFFSIGQRGCCTAKNICPFINFFCSKEHIEDWKNDNSDYKTGMIFTLDEALEHGKIIFSDLLK